MIKFNKKLQTRHLQKIGLLCLFAIGFICENAAAKENRVLIVHSAHPGSTWVEGINAAIKAPLDRSAIDHKIIYLNTDQNGGVSTTKKACLRAVKFLNQYRPQVVIAVDDDAQRYFVKPLLGKTDTQFVFCGVNAEPERYGYPADNVTGILERTYPDQALRLLKMILPGAKKAVCLSDDSFNSKLVIPRLKNYPGHMPIQLTSFIQPPTFSKWIKKVNYYGRDNAIDAFLIPFTNSVKQDWNQKSMSPAEVMMWTADNVTKPIVGLWPSAAEHGALCAVVVDPKEHGTVAALMAKKIISGEKAAQIPIVTNQDGFVVINLKAADRLNIDVPFTVLQCADNIIE